MLHDLPSEMIWWQVLACWARVSQRVVCDEIQYPASEARYLSVEEWYREQRFR